MGTAGGVLLGHRDIMRTAVLVFNRSEIASADRPPAHTVSISSHSGGRTPRGPQSRLRKRARSGMDFDAPLGRRRAKALARPRG